MGKPKIHNSSWMKVALVFAAMVMMVLPGGDAHADSTPPPSVLWLAFENQAAQAPKLEGVQLIACMTAECDPPVLLQQYGTCDGEGCIRQPAVLTGLSNSFSCAAGLCRSSAFPSHGGTGFKLVVQSSDRVRASGVVGQMPSRYGEATSWKVIVGETSLTVEPASLPVEANPSQSYPRQPVLLFGLSILVELLVAGLCFHFGARSEPQLLEGRLGMVFLANLVSLPVVWYFFPSLDQFQSTANQELGVFVLFAALIYAGLFAGIYRTEKKTRRGLIILAAVLLPVTAFCYLAAFMVFGHGSSDITVAGLPVNVSIIASEVFAVAFEAFLIGIMSKRSMSLRLIWITSLLMNAASFAAGQTLTGRLQDMPSQTLVTQVPPPTPEPPTPVTTVAVEPGTWTSLGPNEATISALAVDPLTPSTIYAMVSFSSVVGGVFKSMDGGATWKVVSTLPGSELAVDPLTPSTLYVGTSKGVYKSTDGGGTWNAASTGLASPTPIPVFGETGYFVYALVIDPRTPATLYAGTYQDGVFKSTDAGATWKASNSGLTNTSVMALVIDPQTTATLYAGTSSGIFKSTDAGANWEIASNGMADSTATTLAIDPAMPSSLYAGSFRGVFKSTDGGGTWGLVYTEEGLTDMRVLVVDPVNPSTVYAGTSNGVYISKDGGGTWKTLGTGLTPPYVESMKVAPGNPTILYAGTMGGGVFAIMQK